MELHWYRVSDNHSGGGRNTPYEWYQIQAPSERLAILAWEEYTGHDIHEVACECCGHSFSFYEVGEDDLFSVEDNDAFFAYERDVLTLDWATIVGTQP